MDRRRLLLLAPLGVAAAGGVAFWSMLDRMSAGTFDPHGVPNPLVGHVVPAFDLPGQRLPGQTLPDGAAAAGFSSAALAAMGRPVLVNFFASWCIPCVQESPLLMQLSRTGLPIWGVDYKDKAENATDFLSHNGNPYSRVARDAAGRTAIDWGVYGVPESYLIDAQGVVRWRWAGPLDPDTVASQLLPLLRRIG
ncbi:MAG: DsbE family thiol:disulfide interchange protein [Janthinobacterium lividum]